MKRYTDKRGLGRGEEGKQAGKEIREKKKESFSGCFHHLDLKIKMLTLTTRT